MYKYLTKFLFLLFMTTSFSVVAKNDVVKVYDKGADGMRRYHAVVCPDGNKIYITQMLNKRGESVSSGDAISLEPLVDEDEDFSETTTKPATTTTCPPSSLLFKRSVLTSRILALPWDDSVTIPT